VAKGESRDDDRRAAQLVGAATSRRWSSGGSTTGTGRAGTVGVWSSPQAAAGAHNADLIWYRRNPGPAPVAGPPNGALWRFAS